MSLYSSHRLGPRYRTTLSAGKRFSGMPHRCNSRQSNIGWSGDCGGTLTLAGRRTVQESKGHVGRVASKIVNGHQRSTDHPRAEENAERSKQRSIRRSVKVGEHSLVRIRSALRVRAEGEIKDCRVAWKARAATQDLRREARWTRQMSAVREIA